MSAAFEEAEYEDREFEGIALPGERLADLDFCDCVFRACDLSEAELLRCRFDRCRFEGSNLSSVRLTDSRIGALALADTKAIGVDWTRVSSFSRPELTFVDCDLSWSAFLEMDLRRFVLERCRAVEVDFSGATLEGAAFVDSDLSGARFVRTRLSGADFRSARNYRIDPTANRLAGARFSLPEAISLLGAFDIVLE